MKTQSPSSVAPTLEGGALLKAETGAKTGQPDPRNEMINLFALRPELRLVVVIYTPPGSSPENYNAKIDRIGQEIETRLQMSGSFDKTDRQLAVLDLDPAALDMFDVLYNFMTLTLASDYLPQSSKLAHYNAVYTASLQARTSSVAAMVVLSSRDPETSICGVGQNVVIRGKEKLRPLDAYFLARDQDHPAVFNNTVENPAA